MARGKKKESALTLEEKLAQALVPDWEQPYKVPKNWGWTTLGSLVETSKEKTEDFSDPDVKYVGLEHLEKDAGIIGSASAEGVKSLKNVFHPGQILYGKLRPYLNKHDVADFDGVCSTDILVFNVRKTAIAQYVDFFLNQRSFIEYAVANSKGINLPRVSEGTVLDAVCPLPPLAEQQRIVDRIEYLFAKLDEAKEKAQSVLDSFETRKAAILHKAFTGELTAKWRSEQGVGQEGWERTNIGSIADVKGGKRVPKGMELTTENAGHPYIKAGNLKQGTVIDDGMMYVPDDVLQYIKNYTVQAGDVYITNVGACIGDCGVIPPKYDGANLTENAVKITNLRCNGDYLALFLASNTVQQRIKSLIASATLGKLSIANIKTIVIDLPSSKEQMEIVSIIKRLFAKEQQAKEASEAVLEKIDLLKKAILARAFRGELGTNDPTEESALELLKQVLQEDAPTVTRKRSKSIPKELQAKLSTELERKIVKLYFKQETDSLPAEELLSVSSKKFDVMEALHNLEGRGILKKLPNENYRLLE